MRGGAGHAQRLAGQASLAKEVAGAQNGNHRFLALLGDDRELDLAFLDIEDGVGRVALQEDLVVLRMVGQRPSFAGCWREKSWDRNPACLSFCGFIRDNAVSARFGNW